VTGRQLTAWAACAFLVELSHTWNLQAQNQKPVPVILTFLNKL
jgi:hypothetical protein